MGIAFARGHPALNLQLHLQQTLLYKFEVQKEILKSQKTKSPDSDSTTMTHLAILICSSAMRSSSAAALRSSSHAVFLISRCSARLSSRVASMVVRSVDFSSSYAFNFERRSRISPSWSAISSRCFFLPPPPHAPIFL